MNDQLQKALADLLAKANQGIDAGATFLQAQLPDVVQQLLWWKAIYSGIWFALSFPLAYSAWRLSKSAASASPDKYGFMKGATALKIIAAMVVGGLAFLAFMTSWDWLQILVAPKVYLLEYAAKLGKGV